MYPAFTYWNACGGENNQKNMQHQYWQAEDVLTITNMHVNEALLSADEGTAFPVMECADSSPYYLSHDRTMHQLRCHD